MFITFLILSFLTFLIFSYIAYTTRNNQVKSLSIILIGIILATGFLVFPLFQEKDLISDIIMSTFYAIKIPSMSGEFEILASSPNNLYLMFEILLYFYSILAPILTAGVIVSFISNKIDELRATKKTRKIVHIFTDINEKSLTLAESIRKKEEIIIFLNPFNKKENYERIKNINGIILKKSLNLVNLKKYLNEVKVYALSLNEDDNLTTALRFIEKNKNTKTNITLNVFTTANEAQIILDSTEKGNIKTIIINEIEQMIYTLLDEKPLYTSAIKNKIKVLVIGAGNVGMSFIKAITWCGQMANYSLEIKVIDKLAKKREAELLWNAPELKKPYYNISFFETNIKNDETRKILEKEGKNVNYIIIALGNDTLNLNTALELRTYYLKNHISPFISLIIKNEEKKKQIELLKNERGASYDIYPFGSLKDMYKESSIINEKIEKMSQNVHLSYSPEDKELKEYYKIEYNKKSSRASALHIKYKLYSVTGKENLSIKEIKTLLNNKKTLDILAENEHKRWTAYMRSVGYSVAKIEDVKKYYPLTKNHVYHLAKLHPGLVPFNKLDNVSKELTKITKSEKDLKKSDYDIVEAIPTILKEEK